MCSISSTLGMNVCCYIISDLFLAIKIQLQNSLKQNEQQKYFPQKLITIYFATQSILIFNFYDISVFFEKLSSQRFLEFFLRQYKHLSLNFPHKDSGSIQMRNISDFSTEKKAGYRQLFTIIDQTFNNKSKSKKNQITHEKQ